MANQNSLIDNKNAETHGGAAAVKAVQFNAPFSGLAAAAEQDVMDELARDGPQALLERNAIRLQVCADLYYTAVQKAADDRDIDRMTALLKVWGWLASASLRGWDAVLKEMRGKGKRIDPSMILDSIIKGGDHDESESHTC